MLQLKSSSLVLLALLASLLIAADPAGEKRAAPSPVVGELLVQRLHSAQAVYQQDLARIRAAEAVADDRLAAWSERWLDADLALSGKPAERIAALRAHLERTREIEKLAGHRAKIGQGREADMHATAWYRINAEIRLAEELRE